MAFCVSCACVGRGSPAVTMDSRVFAAVGFVAKLADDVRDDGPSLTRIDVCVWLDLLAFP